MSDIPENEVTLEDVKEWYLLQRELSRLKAKEGMLRSRIFRHFFTNPKEGTNNYDLNDGTGALLKGTYVINRSVDEGALDVLKGEFREKYRLRISDLIRYKPELVLSEYRKLTEEERNAFDQVLIIKPGSPQMEVAIPKRVQTQPKESDA